MKTQESLLHKIAYSRREAAAVLGISLPTLDRLAERGLIRPSRACRRPIYSHKELERFLADTSAAINL